MTTPEIDIFLLAFNRFEVFKRVLLSIHQRTRHPYYLHVFDNASHPEMKDWLYRAFCSGEYFISSLHLENINRGPYYPKAIQHAQVESGSEFYVVTDGDIEVPNLEPGWLSRLIDIMKARPRLGVLAAQVPPVWLQQPYRQDDEVVYCRAVGNTLKVIRRSAAQQVFHRWSQDKWRMFGDDTEFCHMLHDEQYLVGYARHVFCHNLGQKENWGYAPGEEKLDPRKKDEQPPLYIQPVNMQTYETPEAEQFLPGVRFQHDAPI